MKVAVPVKDDSLTFFSNAGHAPFFAIFSVKGGGMFKSFSLEVLVKNPKVDSDEEHHHDDEAHTCNHDENDTQHVQKHTLMAEAIQDCDYIVIKKACKNTVKSMNDFGIKIKKYNSDSSEAKKILSEMSSQLI
ncbi:hypothetical protein KKG72_06455 [bacterium]|nr:hypothetical protein [bacterium]MBU1993317.1 hypothetical protein [bacterium]